VRNGLGGRYYKTGDEVRKRVARVVTPALEPLVRVSVGGSEHAPTLTWHRDPAAIERTRESDVACGPSSCTTTTASTP
jgi:hypothetical protein